VKIGPWGELVFAQPQLLLLLLLPIAFAYLRGRAGGAPAIRYSDTLILQALGPSTRRSSGRLRILLLHIALAAFVISLARPRWEIPQRAIRASGIDILLALDVSRSMLAEDFTIGGSRANRLEAVKRVTEKFIEGRPNDRIGIIAFAGHPYLVSPLTLDHDWLDRNLERLRIGLVEDGTAIGSAIASGANRLKESSSKTKIMLLLTDGDNNAGRVEPETAAEAAAALGIKIYTIGAGTRGTAPYPVVDPFGRTVYREVQVQFDEARLKRIADATSGRNYRATDTRSLNQIFEEIDRFEKSEIDLKHYREIVELFPWPLGLGLLLLAAQITLGTTLWRTSP
jgi:Ca-activated chloride channel homolog